LEKIIELSRFNRHRSDEKVIPDLDFSRTKRARHFKPRDTIEDVTAFNAHDLTRLDLAGSKECAAINGATLNRGFRREVGHSGLRTNPPLRVRHTN
jgi:hypothetical protein